MDTVIPGKYVRWILTLLFAALALLCVLWVSEYRYLRRQHVISNRSLTVSQLRKHPLTALDIGAIESWMTFAYVSVAFQLPHDYLANSLKLSDPSYPNISLSHYARRHHADLNALVSAVRDAVTAYLQGPGS